MEFKVNQCDMLNGMKMIEKNGLTLTKTGLVQLQIAENAPSTLRMSLQDETGLTVSTAVPLTVETNQPGTLYAKYDIVRDMMKTIREGEATFSSESELLSYTVGRQIGRIATMGATQSGWKDLTTERGALLNEVTVPGNTLRRMLQGSMYAVAKDDERPILQGVFIEINDNTVTCVGCDGYRLAVVPTTNVRIEHAGKDCGVTISAPMAKTILKQLPKPSKRAKRCTEPLAIIRIFENGLTVDYGVTIAGLTLTGEYVPFRNFIPKKDTSVEAKLRPEDVANMLDTVVRAQVVAKRGNGSEFAHTAFAFTEEGFTVSANAEDMALSENVLAAVAVKNATETKISLNGNYVIDVLKNVDTGNGVKLGMIERVEPFVIEPRTADTPGELHMILPILVRH